MRIWAIHMMFRYADAQLLDYTMVRKMFKCTKKDIDDYKGDSWRKVKESSHRRTVE